MWWQINFYKLAVLWLPTFLRKPVIMAWVKSLVHPVHQLYETWLVRRGEDLYQLEHTGQVLALRKSLNDRFDPQLRRIDIADGNQYSRLYIYTTAEQNPLYLTQPVWLYHRSDYEDTSVDFIVLIPADLWTPENYEMRAHIDFYKQDIKTYKIIVI